ncbi:MAG: hypothetical protein ACKVU4_10925 [Phycisphaerales bacterium]
MSTIDRAPERWSEPHAAPGARRRIGTGLLRAGAALLVVGVGPLVAVMIVDPTSTAVGPGLLFVATFPPSLVLVAIGAALRRARLNDAP